MSDEDKSSNAFFYIDPKTGKKTDEGLFDDEPGDPYAYYDLIVRRAMEEDGMPREKALRSYVPDHHLHLFESKNASEQSNGADGGEIGKLFGP